MSDFKLLRDKKYFESNISNDIKELYRKVSEDSQNGPFLTYDLGMLIINYCFKYHKSPSDIDIEKKIRDAVLFFKKGNENELKEFVQSKLNNIQ